VSDFLSEFAPAFAEKNLGGIAVSNKISVIGVEPHELRWIRMLVSLLRNPDPGTPELARQALLYLVKASAERETVKPGA
jgi:hypothetical protein